MQETQETWVQSLGQEDPLEKEMATHVSIIAWKIPWTEEPGRLQPYLQKVGHDLVTKTTKTNNPAQIFHNFGPLMYLDKIWSKPMVFNNIQWISARLTPHESDIHSWVSFDNLSLSRICPFCLNFLVCWHKVVRNLSLTSVRSVVIFLLSFLMLVMCVFSLCLCVCVSLPFWPVIFSKNQLLHELTLATFFIYCFWLFIISFFCLFWV